MIDDTNGVNALGGASHQPALLACFAATDGPVLEIGMGHSSTPTLHALCCPDRRRLVSLESDPEWRDWFKDWAVQGHEILDDNAENLERMALEHWSVVFIDDSPGRERVHALKLFLDKADYIVIHDAQGEEIMEPIRPLITDCAQFMHKRYFPWTCVISKKWPIPHIP